MSMAIITIPKNLKKIGADKIGKNGQKLEKMAKNSIFFAQKQLLLAIFVW